MLVAACVVVVLGGCGNGDEGVGAVPAPDQEQTATPTTETGPTTTGETTAPRTTGSGSGASAGRDLPRLVEIGARVSGEVDQVVLRFEAGTGQPVASVEEVDDGTVRRPGSGRPVQLAGDQALRVTVSPAVAGEIQPLRPDLPSVAEVRLLGFFEGQITLGIGINGEGDLAPRVDNGAEWLVIGIPHPPYPPDGPDSRACGDISFGPESGAGSIVAVRTSCAIARDVASFAEGQVGDPYGTPSGFSCQVEDVDEEPTRTVDYLCRRGEAEVTFIAG